MILKIKKRTQFIQFAIMAFIWVLLFAVPLLFTSSDGTNWAHIFKIWKEYVYLFFLFLVNRLVLMPFLFFNEKRVAYFATASVLILALFVGLYVNADRNHHVNRRPQGDFRSETSDRSRSRPRAKPGPEAIPPYANLLILSVLILGFDTGLNISMKWVQSEQKRIQLEKENTENKLAFLRNQISPHFLMNTLNNIHALVDYDTGKAQESIIKLSRLMGYLLYETQDTKVPLEKEIRFIKSYVELMQLRYTGKIRIELRISESLPHLLVPPLLFISYIENAFKHGISYQHPSYVFIGFSSSKEWLNFEVENSVHARNEKPGNSGLGIENNRKRLELIYGDKFILKITDLQQSFHVKLNLPV
jgi:hypothetical protein